VSDQVCYRPQGKLSLTADGLGPDVPAELFSLEGDFVNGGVGFAPRLLQSIAEGCDSQNTTAGRHDFALFRQGCSRMKDDDIGIIEECFKSADDLTLLDCSWIAA